MILDKSCAPYQQDEKILEKLNPQITMHSRKFIIKENIYCGQRSSTLVSPFNFLLNKDQRQNSGQEEFLLGEGNSGRGFTGNSH